MKLEDLVEKCVERVHRDAMDSSWRRSDALCARRQTYGYEIVARYGT